MKYNSLESINQDLQEKNNFTTFNFCQAFPFKKPPVRDPTPTWDLPTVLLTLSNPPFEPIGQISLKYLTLKTTSLLAICSANRVHELKALDVRPAFCEFTPRGVTLRTNPSFRPKVLKPANMQRTLHFAPLSGPEADPDNSWESVCLIRTLCRYMEVTKPIRTGTSQLLVTFKEGAQGREASKVTIAQWLKHCVQEAYTLQKLPMPLVKAHSTRKQSVSWASMKNVSIEDICQHACWTNSNTFIKHYRLQLASTVSSRHAQSVLVGALPM